MDSTITIPEPLARTLHTIAVERGISLETVTQRAPMGMKALQAYLDDDIIVRVLIE